MSDPFAAPPPPPSGEPPATSAYGSGQPGYGQPGYGYGLPPGQPPYAPPGYGQPPYGWAPPVAQRTNGLAIASLVLGILWLYWIGSILALVFGYTAKRQIRERGESGDGLATAGIVLGWIGVGFLSLFFLLGLLGFAGSL